MGWSALWFLLPAFFVLAVLGLTELIRKDRWWGWFALLPPQVWILVGFAQSGDWFLALGSAATAGVTCVRGVMGYTKARTAIEDRP